MAGELKGLCGSCNAEFGPIIDRGGTIFRCRECDDYDAIKQEPRQFELPFCARCETQYLEADRVKEGAPSTCTSCGSLEVRWESISHIRLSYEEEDPRIGETAQGYIKNTGVIQRIEFVNSILLGRIGESEAEFEDGTAVEAEVVGLGRRSLDVKNVRAVPYAPRTG